jgi:hypothetical protein
MTQNKTTVLHKPTRVTRLIRASIAIRTTTSGENTTTGKIAAPRDHWPGAGSKKVVVIAIASVERPQRIPKDKTNL